MLIFGNGNGMAQPYWDGRWYWLNDENEEFYEKYARPQLYQFSFGLGAQLYSYQWRAPKVGECRILAGRYFKPVSYTRRWGRCQITWATNLPDDIRQAIKQIKHLQDVIGTGYYTVA